jgi:hypothetical protein
MGDGRMRRRNFRSNNTHTYINYSPSEKREITSMIKTMDKYRNDVITREANKNPHIPITEIVKRVDNDIENMKRVYHK